MMVKGHLLVATACFIVMKDIQLDKIWVLDARIFLEYLVIMVGVLLPDIDHPDSTIGKRVRYLSYPIYIIFGHRRLTHSALFVGAILWYGYTSDNMLICYLAVGAGLHLVGDYLTPAGVPLLFPFGRNYRSPVHAQTNSIGEHVLSFGALVASLIYVLNGHVVF
jgi:inner membrane protein